MLGLFLLFWSLHTAGHGTVVFRELAANVSHLEGMTVLGLPVAVMVGLLRGGLDGSARGLLVW